MYDVRNKLQSILHFDVPFSLPPCRHRGRDQHAHERSKDTNDHEPRVFVKLGSHGRAYTRQVDGGASERVDNDASDEPCDRVREEDERKREQEAPTLLERKDPSVCNPGYMGQRRTILTESITNPSADGPVPRAISAL